LALGDLQTDHFCSHPRESHLDFVQAVLVGLVGKSVDEARQSLGARLIGIPARKIDEADRDRVVEVERPDMNLLLTAVHDILAERARQLKKAIFANRGLQSG